METMNVEIEVRMTAAGKQWETMNVEIETEDNLKPWLRKKLMPPHLSCDKTNPDMGSQCSTSSKDSAYNEGEGNSSNDDGSRGSSPGCKNQPNKSTTSSRSSKSWSVQKTNRRNEDALYVKFLRDITDDILNKGVYTNKGLKLVFQKHINDNMNRLNFNRMKEEVEKLGDKIGIPKNEEDDRIDFGLGSTQNEFQLTKQDQQILGTSGGHLATTFARSPTLSNLRQISKSQTSSSSLDLEKELEALESYSDVELNEAEILDTLTMLNINPKLLENDTKSNATTKQEIRVDPLRTNEKDKNQDEKKTKFEIHPDPFTSTKEHNSNEKTLQNCSKMTTENNKTSNRNKNSIESQKKHS
uniref:Uncharacterized protein n=1 Tax=Cacopsylla melanoneura TaxID=428564 RepID=A0A8D9A1S9_9HEMI